jgi:hypothetical protein
MAAPLIAAAVGGNLAKNKATPYVIGGVVIVTLGLSYFGVIRPILKKLGVLSGKEDKLERELLEMKAFDPNYANPSTTTISHEEAKKLAITIEDSLSWTGDKEEAIYNAFQQAGSHNNMSLISRMYSARFGSSLIEDVTSRFNEEELKKLLIIVERLKK